MKTFQTYRFQKSGLKEYTFRKKKATENGIGLKEYTLRVYSFGTFFGLFYFSQTSQTSKTYSFGHLSEKRQISKAFISRLPYVVGRLQNPVLLVLPSKNGRLESLPNLLLLELEAFANFAKIFVLICFFRVYSFGTHSFKP